MDFENRFTSFFIGKADCDNAVETSRTHKSGIQNVASISGGHHENAAVIIKAIHLHEKLVKGLLAFVIPSPKTGATLTSDGVDFIDEDDARGCLLCFLEKIANTSGANADKHLHEIGTGNAIERHASFAGDRFSQKGFTRSRRTNKKNAFWKSRAEFAIFLRLFEIFNHLNHFRFFFIAPSNVCKADFGSVFATGGGFVEIHRLSIGATHRTAKQREEKNTC